jgi:hypothetical protein
MDVNNLKSITTIKIQLHIGKTLHTISFDVGTMLQFYAALEVMVFQEYV